jgi:uncharacterized lipoprotein YddW (UPF0748 family)
VDFLPVNTRCGVLSSALALVAGVVALAAAEIPAPPAAAWPVFPECQAQTAAAAGQLFQPMEGSPPVALAGSGEQTFFRLPGNFKGTRHERCSWDIKLNADLALARGFQFLFFSADSQPVSYYSVYCHSGDGWYAATLGGDRDGAWQHVVISKSQTGAEGKPAGWGRIDTIRISAWRARDDRDTEFAIARLGPLGAAGAVVVLRADSAAGTPEAGTVRQSSETVGRCLDDLGVDYAVLADLDLNRDRLQGRKLVVLPYNPTVPEAGLAVLRDFVAAGGRLMTFYTVPPALTELMGMRPGQWIRPPEGPFQGLQRVGSSIQGQPEFVGQASWNIVTAYPAADNGKVVAVWRAAGGKDTELPAVTVTPQGIYFGHVLLPDDWTAKKQLMLALLGSQFPDAWSQAARHELARVGSFGSFTSLDEVGAAVARGDASGRPREVWSAAVAAERRAAAALAAGRCDEAITAAREARQSALTAWCMTPRAVPGEHRAFWCHSAFGLPGKTWDEAIALLSRSGFNAILPNLLWGGVAFYPSTVLPPYADLAAKGDQLQLCLDACRKYKVQCHVWKVNWNMGYATDAAYVRRMVEAGRVQRDGDGKLEERWLCPSHPANQQLEIDAMVEIARRYAVDGLHFDYIRYPDGDHCFCDGCRARFEQHLGRALANWPGDVRAAGEVRTQWLAWRRDQITAVVRQVSEQARQVRPGIRISAAVFRNWPTDRDGVGQDWKLWCEKGYLDFACPMDYTDSNQTFRNNVRNQAQWTAGKPLYPGIGLSCWADPRDPVLLLEQIAICRELGTGGFTVFNYDRNAQEVLPYCALGATAE